MNHCAGFPRLALTVLLGERDALEGNIRVQVPAVRDAPLPIVQQQPLRLLSSVNALPCSP